MLLTVQGAAVYVAGSQAGLTPGGTAPRTGGIYSPIDFNAIVKNKPGKMLTVVSSTYLNNAEK